MLSKRCMETQTSQIVYEKEHKQLWHRVTKLDNAKHGKMKDNRQRHTKWKDVFPSSRHESFPICMNGEHERSTLSFHQFEIVKVGRQ